MYCICYVPPTHEVLHPPCRFPMDRRLPLPHPLECALHWVPEVPCGVPPPVHTRLRSPFAGTPLPDWDVFKNGGGVDLLGQLVGLLEIPILGSLDFDASLFGLQVEGLSSAG